MPSSATQRLLEREMPPDYRRQWTEHVAAVVETTVRGSESVIVFRVGSEWMALPTIILQSIAPSTTIHSLPHPQSRIVRGVMNARGSLLLCVSLSALIGISADADPMASSTSRILIVDTGRGEIAIVADEVDGMHRYAPEELVPPPATVARSDVRYTIGLIPYHGRAVMRLDADVLFSAIDRALS